MGQTDVTLVTYHHHHHHHHQGDIFVGKVIEGDEIEWP